MMILKLWILAISSVTCLDDPTRRGGGVGVGDDPPCRQKLVSVASVKCDVEYDRNCTMARKHVEFVAGYRTGNCKQIVKEKCYRRRIGVISHGYDHYKRSAPPEICNEDKQVKCDKVPVYEEEIVDVEVCEDTPRTVCRDSNVLLPKLICTHYLDDRLIFDKEEDLDDGTKLQK